MGPATYQGMKDEENKERWHCSLTACEKLGAIRRYNKSIVRNADDSQHHNNHDGANDLEACAVSESVPRHDGVPAFHVALCQVTRTV